MKITGNRDVFAENLAIVAKAVSTKTTIQILECILITADENGVRFIANDLEIGIETAYINAEVIDEGSVALEAKMLMDIIRRLPMGEVTIESDQNNLTQIKCLKSEFKILGYPGEEFPLLPEIEKTFKHSAPAGILKNMIRQTIFSVATDDSKPVMTGELLEFRDDILKLVAIDGFRVSLREFNLVQEEEEKEKEKKEKQEGQANKEETEQAEQNNEPAEPQKPQAARLYSNAKAVIPGKTLNEISKILPQSDDVEVGIYLAEKHVVFELDNCTVISRLIEGDFINYENIFTPDYTTLVYVNRHELLESIERTSLISKDIKKSPVKLNITADKIAVTSVTEAGNAYDEIAVEIDGIPINIAFNPRYLMDALRAIDEDDIQIQFTTPLSPCIIRNENVWNYKYLILPLKTKN